MECSSRGPVRGTYLPVLHALSQTPSLTISACFLVILSLQKAAPHLLSAASLAFSQHPLNAL